jgi:hypothetical protein
MRFRTEEKPTPLEGYQVGGLSNCCGLEASATYCAEQVYSPVIEVHTMLFCFTEKQIVC